ncbi:MAG: hypothetical protein AVDCRST_MAG12-68, partial [uncultured Rubrobacteraceae bacterium]
AADPARERRPAHAPLLRGDRSAGKRLAERQGVFYLRLYI